MKTSSNNNIESNKVQLDGPKGKVNGMSQVINILTGETKKLRCHYISNRTDKPVSRVLTLERLSHPALTAAGVTAWAERFNDGVNSFDWLRVSIQLTDKICYTPNCANVGLPDVENYGNLDYYKNQEGAMRVYMNNVDKFFQSIADKPAKMMTGEDWPNMAVITAYRAAGRDEEADRLTTARDTYNARIEAKKEAWSKKYAAQQYYYNSPKPKNFDELTELERAQFMMQTAQECVKNHPELDWADILEKAEKRLEYAEKETEEIKVGDRVWCKHGEVMGTVTAIRIWNPDYAFKVKLDKPVTLFGRTFEETEFRRYGITKNYDHDGMVVGNAQYYAEELQADYWGDHKPRTFKFGTNEIEVFTPTEKRPTWLVVADIFSEPKEMTLREVCDYLAACYQKEHKAHGLNEMHAGYFNICKDGELKHEPLFELGTYENGTFFPQAN